MRCAARLAVAITVAAAGLGACSPEDPPPPPEPLDSVVDEVIEAGPGRKSERYQPPARETSQAIAASVAELLATGEVQQLPRDYELEPVTTDDGDPVDALVEQGRRTAGNGLYAARDSSQAPAPLVVQIPHPVADTHSEDMGTQLFNDTNAQLFMVAGAHREAGDDSADVAHRNDATFSAVNEAVLRPEMTVIQLHGFSSDNHDKDYDEVVLSSTVDEPSPLVKKLSKDLSDKDFDTCVYDGDDCENLAGTTNVQSAPARARGVDFIHIEVESDIRDSKSKSSKLVRTIGATLREAGIG